MTAAYCLALHTSQSQQFSYAGPTKQPYVDSFNDHTVAHVTPDRLNSHMWSALIIHTVAHVMLIRTVNRLHPPVKWICRDRFPICFGKFHGITGNSTARNAQAWIRITGTSPAQTTLSHKRVTPTHINGGLLSKDRSPIEPFVSYERSWLPQGTLCFQVGTGKRHPHIPRKFYVSKGSYSRCRSCLMKNIAAY